MVRTLKALFYQDPESLCPNGALGRNVKRSPKIEDTALATTLVLGLFVK